MKRYNIIDIRIETEMDIVLARKNAISICRFTGLDKITQTRFGTAVTESGRNTLEHAQSGIISFWVEQNLTKHNLIAIVQDKGPGIKEINTKLDRSDKHYLKKGTGLGNSRILTDFFNVESNEKGTTIVLGQKIPEVRQFNKEILNEWKQALNTQNSASPYEEIKSKNDEILHILNKLKQKEKETIILNHKLQQRNEDLTTFAYTLSHDLKNPLATILLSTEMLKEDLEEDNPYVEMINRNTGTINNILKGMMEIVEVDKESEVKQICFNELLDKLQEEYSDRITEKNIHITRDIEIGPISYIAVYAESILRNLFSNAIKYSSAEKNPEVVIKISKKDKGIIILEITDNGIGIDLEQNKNRMFKPFERFTDSVEGKGVGLHIVKRMVEKNNGNIDVYSKPGEGTKFICTLKEY